jgi:basic amino acid/polyamine antiporter, APA family
MPATDLAPPTPAGEAVTLARRLDLPLAVLFGLGVTIGAGIYVLIGATAGRAGMHAPLAFLLAALVMAPTAASFAELAGRMPISAGEAAYVRAGFRSEALALVVGCMVIAVGVISAAAISRGSAGYIAEFVDLPLTVIVPAVVLAMGAVAAWGILQSVALAGLLTLIEVGGLLVIIAVGAARSPDLLTRVPEMWTGIAEGAVIAGILSASLLAFFAFIGFEGLANIAEEVKEPEKNLPLAIFLTLGLSTLLYVLVVWIALVSVPRAELATARAPLSLVFERVTGASPTAIVAVAIVATINGIIVQMLMASRVVYGLADRGLLPPLLRRINRRTQTPLEATGLVIVAVLLLAVALPLEGLAEWTSRLTLVVFAFVNAALGCLKWRGEAPPAGAYITSRWVPWTGLGLCLALLVADVVG